MNRDIAKLCLVLANSELTKSQLREACAWIEKNGGKALERAVSRIRLAAENAVFVGEDPIPSSSGRHGQLVEDSNKLDRVPDNAEQVANLLSHETGLTASKASDLLLCALAQNENMEVSSLPRLHKKSFQSWIRRISKNVPYSVLLHEATKIRNDIIKIPKHDWPLRNNS